MTDHQNGTERGHPLDSRPEPWNSMMASMLTDHMKSSGTNYRILAERLKAFGHDDLPESLRARISRGRFSASFMMQCLTAMDIRFIEVPIAMCDHTADTKVSDVPQSGQQAIEPDTPIDQIDGTTVILLSNAPVTKWAKIIRRITSVRRYLAEGKFTMDAAERHASEAGIAMSLFYKLTKQYTTARKTPPEKPDQSGRGVHSGTLRAISGAIDHLGSGATQAMILSMARSICEENNIPLPSANVVRSVHGRRGAGPSIMERTNIADHYAFDHTALEIQVRDVDGQTKRPILNCIVDMHTSRIASHSITLAEPESEEYERLLRSSLNHGAAIRLPYLTGPDDRAEVTRMTMDAGLKPRMDHRKASGRIIRAAFGVRIGRIEFVKQRKEQALRGVDNDLETVTLVVDNLIRLHNQRLDEEDHKEDG